MRNWATSNQITNSALSELLRELNKHQCFDTLCIDARTLLKTPLQYETKTIEPGEYIHFGLCNGIRNIIKEYNFLSTCIEVIINIDGLPINKSSNSSFWPILGLIVGHGQVFIIGVYYGNKKPKNVNNFLHDFVSEAVELYTNGIFINNFLYQFKIKYFVCDAPAKSYILQCRGHTGYFSCTKCTVRGIYKNRRICFPEINASKRIDKDFRYLLHTDDSYHLSYTILEKIPDLDFVNDFVLDYMHLVCLGVTRKLLHLWLNRNTGCRLSYNNVIEKISNNLESLRPYISREFVRKPCSLKYVKLWKATEYRQMLLYTGPIALKSVLSKDNYKHFLSLHVSIRILCKEDTKNAYAEYSQKLLEHFVKSFIKLYGKHCVSHNVHGLIHLVEDAKNFSILDNFSAFKFENFMQILKRFIRKSEKPLQQLFRRYNETRPIIEKKEISKKLYPIITTCHHHGPLLPLTRNPQYAAVGCNYFRL